MRPGRRVFRILSCFLVVGTVVLFLGGSGGRPVAAGPKPPAEPPPDANQPTGPAVPSRAAYATTLPDSAGRGIAERWCLLCHSAMLITQQKKDSTGWEKTLAQMEKWGVTPTPEERDTLRAYLLQNFGRPIPR